MKPYAGIAISGRAGTGKSTLADALVAAGIVEKRVSLSGALKDDLATLGVEKGQPHARSILIEYGQNRRAVMGAGYWIGRLEELHGNRGYVVDDVRFPNEHAYFATHGFLMVRLSASPSTRARRLGLAADDPFLKSDDPSEASLEKTLAMHHLRFYTDGMPVEREVALVRERWDARG